MKNNYKKSKTKRNEMRENRPKIKPTSLIGLQAMLSS